MPEGLPEGVAHGNLDDWRAQTRDIFVKLSKGICEFNFKVQRSTGRFLARRTTRASPSAQVGRHRVSPPQFLRNTVDLP